MDLLATLKRFGGHDSFRPLQERIVYSLIAGKDTCVVMPTGGGKSLCYQLPAARAADRIVIVVSPLIALRQDQVAQLGQMGIPAEVFNSLMPGTQQGDVVREAVKRRYRLLYLSPERLGAVGYRGKMNVSRRNRERWTLSEVRVLVGMIAFGLGFNKAARGVEK
jgi:ATP-dependent DNA helicase RecQ